jgi:hypothetical protein
MTEAQRAAIKRSIEIHEHDAEELKMIFYQGGQWESSNHKDDYKELKALAKSLRTLLGKE